MPTPPPPPPKVEPPPLANPVPAGAIHAGEIGLREFREQAKRLGIELEPPASIPNPQSEIRNPQSAITITRIRVPFGDVMRLCLQWVVAGALVSLFCWLAVLLLLLAISP